MDTRPANENIIFKIIFAGTLKRSVTNTPITPEKKPKVADSAKNTLDTSFFLAPKLLKTPISFLLSNTEVYTIIAIIIEDTISDIAEKPISTPVTVFVKVST